MSHVGIERLGPGHRQHRRTHRQEALEGIVDEQPHRMIRAQCPQHIGPLSDRNYPQHRDDGEIDQHDRAEEGSDLGRSPALDQEQEDQDADNHRHHQPLHCRVIDRHALDRAQHRNRRGNHAVAIEQRRGKNPQQHDPARPRLARNVLIDEREKRQTAAFALVVGPHDDADVLDRDDDHHRPEHQADDAEHMQPVERQGVMPGEGIAHGVERAGADIAEHNPDRADRQRDLAAVVLSVTAG